MSFPNNLAYSERTVQVFYANNGSMQTWIKPPNSKFVHFYVIGGGGGGGAGHTSTINTNRNGGGGGAGSAITIGLFQANVLPDILYLQVGAGGTGGTQGATSTIANGGAGGISYVKIDPSNTITAQNVVLASATSSASSFGTGGNAGGAGGAAPSAWAATNSIFNDLGLVTVLAGDAGVNGNTNKTLARICSGGAGGGSCVTSTANSGGTLDAGGFISDVLGGPNTGGDGSGGVATNLPSIYSNVYQPMYFLSGAGGGAINSGTGGAGGNGAYGAGGGGGGAATTGGRGGRGGDGLIIITTF